MRPIGLMSPIIEPSKLMDDIIIHGNIVDKADAKISIYDHGCLYGDGVIEGILLYSGKVFKHREHIDRLYESARAILLEIPLTPDQMMAAVEQTTRAFAKKDGYIRLVV